MKYLLLILVIVSCKSKRDVPKKYSVDVYATPSFNDRMAYDDSVKHHRKGYEKYGGDVFSKDARYFGNDSEIESLLASNPEDNYNRRFPPVGIDESIIGHPCLDGRLSRVHNKKKKPLLKFTKGVEPYLPEDGTILQDDSGTRYIYSKGKLSNLDSVFANTKRYEYPGGETTEQILARFGPDVLSPDTSKIKNDTTIKP